MRDIEKMTQAFLKRNNHLKKVGQPKRGKITKYKASSVKKNDILNSRLLLSGCFESGKNR